MKGEKLVDFLEITPEFLCLLVEKQFKENVRGAFDKLLIYIFIALHQGKKKYIIEQELELFCVNNMILNNVQVGKDGTERQDDIVELLAHLLLH